MGRRRRDSGREPFSHRVKLCTSRYALKTQLEGWLVGPACIAANGNGRFTVCLALCTTARTIPFPHPSEALIEATRLTILQNFGQPGEELPTNEKSVELRCENSGAIFDMCFCGLVVVFTLPATKSVGLCGLNTFRMKMARLPSDITAISCRPIPRHSSDRIAPKPKSLMVALGTVAGMVMICRFSIEASTFVVEPVMTLGLPEVSKGLPLTRLSLGTSASTFGFSVAASSCFSDRVFVWTGPTMNRPTSGPETVPSSRFGPPVAAVNDSAYVFCQNREAHVVRKGPPATRCVLDASTTEGCQIADVFTFAIGEGGLAVALGNSDGTVQLAFVDSLTGKWEWCRAESEIELAPKRHRQEKDRCVPFQYAATALTGSDANIVSVLRVDGEIDSTFGFTLFSWTIESKSSPRI